MASKGIFRAKPVIKNWTAITPQKPFGEAVCNLSPVYCSFSIPSVSRLPFPFLSRSGANLVALVFLIYRAKPASTLYDIYFTSSGNHTYISERASLIPLFFLCAADSVV